MNCRFIVLLVSVMHALAAADGAGANELIDSQARGEDESFEAAVARYEARISAASPPRDARQAWAASAMRSASSVARLNVRDVPSWRSLRSVQQAFRWGRDTRFMRASSTGSVLRRPSWLYPDDGCFARSQLLTQKIFAWMNGRSSTVFAFGNLSQSTPFHPRGRVAWWYHMAPVVRVGSQLYVIDPGVDWYRPLPIRAWISRISHAPSAVKVAICGANTYAPRSACWGNRPPSLGRVISHQQKYLNREYSRLRSLNRNAYADLGNVPPWKR